MCVKQVPDTSKVTWSKDNNLVREGMISILNPYDEFAISCALEIKKKFKNVVINVISMGPNQAKEVLEYALARGCDRAILLSDKKFAASDTLATGTILAAGIKKFIPDFDLILCGQFAIDGDTAQTGATISSILNVPLVSYVDKIVNADKNMAIVKQAYEAGDWISKVQNPSVVCVLGKETKKQLRVGNYVRAQDLGIETYGFSDLDLKPDEVGILGSPTYVKRAFRLEYNREKQEITENVAEFLCKLAKGEKNG